jgi:hypothetical protein
MSWAFEAITAAAPLKGGTFQTGTSGSRTSPESNLHLSRTFFSVTFLISLYSTFLLRNTKALTINHGTSSQIRNQCQNTSANHNQTKENASRKSSKLPNSFY